MALNESSAPMLKLYEDIGSLKALFTSIDKKLDGVMEEFSALRDEQVQVRLEVSSGSESINRIENSVTAVEKRVDQLVALRHRIGGAVFLITMTGGAVFSAWDVIARLVTGLMHIPK
jgi:hypothetical protein